MKTILPLAFVVALLCLGCQPAEEDLEPEQPSVAFEGKVDPQYATTWKTLDGKSTYQLTTDGRYVLDSLVLVKGQSPMKTHSEGKWKIGGDRMLFQDAAMNVVPYAYELKGNELTLTLTGSMKNKTILRRR